MEKGIMIVIDGGNGSGKSSALSLIVRHFEEKGRHVVVTREPGGTPIGEKIREILLDPKNKEMTDITELMLFGAARAQHLREKILPAIEAGHVLISDRFSSATVAFQGYSRGIDRKLIDTVNTLSIGGFSPDLTIILDIDPEIGHARVMARGEALERIESQSLALLNRARIGYLKQAKDAPDRFAVIDASASIEKVHAEIKKVLCERI